MPEEDLQTCAYQIVRYQPNLVRDEWVNIGVVLLDPGSGRVRQRLLDDPADFARLRRLHPAADEQLLLRVAADFERQFAAHEDDAGAFLEKLGQTLSNAVQLGPRRGLLAADADAALERLYREQVEPLRAARPGAADVRTRSEIRARVASDLRAEKILPLFARGVRIEEFTFRGDPLRIDFAYRRNGTRGFVQALALGRDPSQAKLLAFTADAIRGRIEKVEFAAVTEREPEKSSARDQFVAGLLAERRVPLVPLPRLRRWAHELAPALRAASSH